MNGLIFVSGRGTDLKQMNRNFNRAQITRMKVIKIEGGKWIRVEEIIIKLAEHMKSQI